MSSLTLKPEAKEFNELDAICNILKEMVYCSGSEILRTRCSLLGVDWKPVEQTALEVRRILRGKKK